MIVSQASLFLNTFNFLWIKETQSERMWRINLDTDKLYDYEKSVVKIRVEKR